MTNPIIGSNRIVSNAVFSRTGNVGIFNRNRPAAAGVTVNLAALPTSVTTPNYTTYNALNVPSLPAGGTYQDPQTNVTIWKITANGTPANASFGCNYSTFGLQISQAWGTNLDNYTLAFLGSDNNQYLVDFNLTTGPSNYRTWPAGEGAFAFSRKAGWERIAYVATGTQLRLYNTQTNAFDDNFLSNGIFPRAWTAVTWMQCNGDETWFTGLPAFSGTTVTAIRPSDNTVLTRTGQTGLDEIYTGFNNIAMINRGQRTPYLWNLDTDTITGPVTMPNANTIINHVPSLKGFWIASDTDSGGGITPFWRINEDGSNSFIGNFPTFMWQYHWSSHAWGVGQTGGDQYAVASMWGNFSWAGSLPLAIAFAKCDGTDYRALCHSYTIYTGPEDYRAIPFANESNDRRIVGFNSNMNDSGRYDLFVAILPTTS